MNEILNLHDFPHGVRRAPGRYSAYRISYTAKKLRVSTGRIFGKFFPTEFSILLAVKPKMSQRRNRGDSYVLLFTDVDGDIQFGIRLSHYPSVVYRQTDGEIRELNFTAYSLDRSWHYLAINVTPTAVTLIADCDKVFTMDIDWGDRSVIDAYGMTSIGPGRSTVSKVYFEVGFVFYSSSFFAAIILFSNHETQRG